MAARRAAALLAIAAVGLAGCRIDVAAEAGIDVGGGGELLVEVRIDGATLRELDALGVDPGLVALGELDPALGWRTSREVDADGGLVLGHRLAFADGPGLAAALGGLDDGLAPDDPALRVDVAVVTARGGAVEVAGTAGFTPPGTAGLLDDGVPVGPSSERLATLTAEAVHPVLRLRVPGRVLAHDGDRIEDRTVTWALPVGGVRPVTLSSAPAGWWRALPVMAAALVVATAVVLWRRRSRDASDPGGSDAAVSPAG